MRARSPFVPCALLAVVAVTSCSTAETKGSSAALGDQATLGQDLAGEQCRAVARSGPPPIPGAPPPLDIFCGAAEEPGGSLWTDALPPRIGALQGAARRAAIERAAIETVEGENVAQRMSCAPPDWLGGGTDTFLYTCILKNGGWPQIVVVSAPGTALYQAEGLPSMWPVLLAAISQKAGRSLDAGDSGEVVKKLEASLKGDTSRIGGADVAKFNQLTRLGRLYNSTHNFAAAEDTYRQALEIETRVFGPDSEGVGGILIELALEVSNQGRFEEAAALFRRADPIVERAPGESLRARYFSYLALDAANQNKSQDALTYAREATAIRRKLAEEGDSSVGGVTVGQQQLSAKGELVHSLRIEAAMGLRLGELDDAEAAISEALEIMSEVRGLPLSWRVEALSLLGQIDTANGRTVAAERTLNASVAFSRKLFGSSPPTAQALLRLARFHLERERYDDALADYRAAFEIIAPDEVARAELVADQVEPFFDAATTVGARSPDQRETLAREMFRVSQLINSGVTDQTISRASARLATNDPAIQDLIRQTQEAERERDTARLQLANEQAKPDDERGSVREAALARNVDEANGKAELLRRKLQDAYPAYVSFAAPDLAGLPRLQELLGSGEAFLTFVIGRERSYAMLVRRDSFVVRQIEVTAASLAADVAALRRTLEPRLGVLPDYDLEAAYALYRKIVGPIEPMLDGVDHLIVAPGGALASLPFALLVSDAPAARHSYSNAAWMIRRMAVSDVPSARAFIDLRKARAHAKPAPRPFLGVGNPSFTGAVAPISGDRETGSALDRLAGTCREKGPVPAGLIRALPPLPETADEVRRVAQRLGADSNSVLLGAAATEANLRRQPLQDYNVLYFATHGLLPGELRCESEPGLALSPPQGEAASPDDDGLLDASEVASLNLNADLVILSACNTATGGSRFGGEALSGLAEAFFYAGARTLVASHWQVPSRATAELMTDLFDRLGPRLAAGVSESLRRAQLALAGNAATAHPFYWAAFAVIGDGGAPGAGAETQARSQALLSGAGKRGTVTP